MRFKRMQKIEGEWLAELNVPNRNYRNTKNLLCVMMQRE